MNSILSPQIFIYKTCMNQTFFIYLFQTAKEEPETRDEPGPVTATVPDPCCTESMLGLLNIAPEQDIWQLLRVSSVFTVI